MAESSPIPIGRTGKAFQAGRSGNLNSVTHGSTTGGPSPEWRAWKNMRQRCNNPNNPRYPLYGGRGIRVCDRWQSDFAAFLHDMGDRPADGWSLDRIDVDGDYEPDNCRWSNQKEQCRNQRRNRTVTYGGIDMTLAQLAEVSGVDSSHLRYHLDRGKSADEAVAFVLEKRKAKS